ncbi:MAG: hypothetical protein IKN17_01320 [Ruminococcus sp.]|nr:hypothetical protein [Ruminococcus sp.]
MKKEIIAELIGSTDDRFISEAAEYEGKPGISVRAKIIGAAAAACIAIAGTTVFMLRSGDDKVLYDPPAESNAGNATQPAISSPAENAASSGSENEQYAESGALLYPWRYLTIYEKYNTIIYGGEEYFNTGADISDTAKIGQKLGECTGRGFDEYEDKEHTEQFEFYEVNGLSPEVCAAVLMEGKYYTCQPEKYAPPATLGELMSGYKLSDNLDLDWLRLVEDGESIENKRLTDVKGFWDMLTEYGDAAVIDQEEWNRDGSKYGNLAGFCISSEVFGIGNMTLNVFKSGYIWTNAFRYAYIYDIGTEAAEKLISFISGHIEDYTPVSDVITVSGKVTWVKDYAIGVDNSISCTDSTDRREYTVSITDIRVKRSVEFPNKLEPGEDVRVSFKADPGVIDGDEITEPRSISRIRSDGPETEE